MSSGGGGGGGVGPWGIALDIIEDVRGTMIFYFFIIEESIQSASFACYLLNKAGMKEDCRYMAQWCIDNLIDPAIETVKWLGIMIYPMNIAYDLFYKSAKKLMETYLKVTEKKEEE